MLKTVGAVMVIAGTVGLAWREVNRLRERTKVLRSLQGTMSYLEEELTFRLTPLPNLFEHLAKNRQGGVSRFFQTVWDAMDMPESSMRQNWVQAARKELSILKEAERQTVEELGEVLGQYDAQTQAQALRLAGERLAGAYAEAKADQQRLGKVYLALGVAGGLATVLVLI